MKLILEIGLNILVFVIIYLMATFISNTNIDEKYYILVIKTPKFLRGWARPLFLFQPYEREIIRLLGVIYHCVVAIPSAIILPALTVYSVFNFENYTEMRYQWTRFAFSFFSIFVLLRFVLDTAKILQVNFKKFIRRRRRRR